MKIGNRNIKAIPYKEVEIGESFEYHPDPCKTGHHCIKLADGTAVDLQLCKVILVDSDMIVPLYKCHMESRYIDEE